MQASPLVVPGQVYRCDHYYQDGAGWHAKYLLVLAADADNVVYRLLTSRPHARPETPPCYHGDPYPGFYLGLIGASLTAKSWLDLRRQDDYDARTFAQHIATGTLALVIAVPTTQICAALACTANAEDTTCQQARQMLDTRWRLGCA